MDIHDLSMYPSSQMVSRRYTMCESEDEGDGTVGGTAAAPGLAVLPKRAVTQMALKLLLLQPLQLGRTEFPTITNTLHRKNALST